MSKARFLAFGLLVVLVSQAGATGAGGWKPPAGIEQVSIWPDGAPDMPGQPQPQESVFEVKKVSGRHYTGVADVSVPTMTVFRPTRKTSDAALIVFPGGGFQILAIDLEGTEICDWVVSTGLTCVLLKYRVPKATTIGTRKPRVMSRPRSRSRCRTRSGRSASFAHARPSSTLTRKRSESSASRQAAISSSRPATSSPTRTAPSIRSTP